MGAVRTEHRLRREVVRVARLLWSRGWVANHDGNVTARLSEGLFVSTPTALSKRLVEHDSLLLMDVSGRKVRGALAPFSERGLHLVVYRHRTDVGAVVHAHPPHATARAVVGLALPCFLPEAVVSLGAEVPLVPFAPPGPEAERALAPFVEDYDAVLLERHGVLAWGEDPEQAFLRLELVEHLAHIASLAAPHGGVRPLPSEVVSKLLLARVRAGLGTEGRRKQTPPG